MGKRKSFLRLLIWSFDTCVAPTAKTSSAFTPLTKAASKWWNTSMCDPSGGIEWKHPNVAQPVAPERYILHILTINTDSTSSSNLSRVFCATRMRSGPPTSTAFFCRLCFSVRNSFEEGSWYRGYLFGKTSAARYMPIFLHSNMHSTMHPTTHSTTHSTTDPSQIAARSVSFVLSSFTFFFRVSLFYTCCFFCVILLRDNACSIPKGWTCGECPE